MAEASLVKTMETMKRWRIISEEFACALDEYIYIDGEDGENPSEVPVKLLRQ